jgi:hypothetical protein
VGLESRWVWRWNRTLAIRRDTTTDAAAAPSAQTTPRLTPKYRMLKRSASNGVGLSAMVQISDALLENASGLPVGAAHLPHSVAS